MQMPRWRPTSRVSLRSRCPRFPIWGRWSRGSFAAGRGRSAAGRIAIVDIDGLIVNQNLTGLNSAGENPVAAFREKLALAAYDPAVRAAVLRINSPGGGVAASELMAEELRRFRLETGKPVVACMMDLATGGAYYIAVGADLIVAQPSAITGSIGALVNNYNLEAGDGDLEHHARHDQVG